MQTKQICMTQTRLKHIPSRIPFFDPDSGECSWSPHVRQTCRRCLLLVPLHGLQSQRVSIPRPIFEVQVLKHLMMKMLPLLHNLQFLPGSMSVRLQILFPFVSCSFPWVWRLHLSPSSSNSASAPAANSSSSDMNEAQVKSSVDQVTHLNFSRSKKTRRWQLSSCLDYRGHCLFSLRVSRLLFLVIVYCPFSFIVQQLPTSNHGWCKTSWTQDQNWSPEEGCQRKRVIHEGDRERKGEIPQDEGDRRRWAQTEAAGMIVQLSD